MSLKDKISFCSGKDFWQIKDFEKYGIPSLFMSDGPHGLRKQEVLTGADMLGLNESLPAACLTGMEHCQVLCPAMFTPMFISRSYRKVNSVS